MAGVEVVEVAEEAQAKDEAEGGDVANDKADDDDDEDGPKAPTLSGCCEGGVCALTPFDRRAKSSSISSAEALSRSWLTRHCAT